ncbi:MAG: sigma-54-dependent transcriptional regulator [Acidobacteriota bacterium]
MTRSTILILEDEAENLRSLTRALEKVGFRVAGYQDPVQGLRYLQEQGGVDLVLTDLRMPGMDGMEVLKRVKHTEPTLPVLLITAFGSVESAVEAMKVGADDYLAKPVDLYELRRRVQALVERRRLSVEVDELKARLDERFGFENIVGSSPPMRELFDQIRMVAPTRATVLIRGESGTGKELIANAIHQHSDRKRGRFLPINCAAIPATLMESELFGHEKGSFTGADRAHPGKFEQAHGGTLFLDEIGELSLDLQAKLLRVLEEKTVTRVGGTQGIPVDVRILTATNRDLHRLAGEGRFREDLLYRLKVVELRIPPLRERGEDIPRLAHTFVAQLAQEYGKPITGISPEVLQALAAFPWPGNVRELKNVIERMVIFCHDTELRESHLPPELRSHAGSLPAASPEPPAGPALSAGPRPPAARDVQPLDALERDAILETLKKTGGNKTQTARLLGIGLRTLHRKLKIYRYDDPESDQERSSV